MIIPNNSCEDCKAINLIRTIANGALINNTYGQDLCRTDKKSLQIIKRQCKNSIKNEKVANQIFDRYIKEKQEYIGKVLDRKCKDKWAYCQGSFIALDRICLENLK